MADSPVLYVYYRPDNDDSYPGVPNRHITEADWARFSLSQRRTVENATTQEGYTRRKVWVHIDLVDETEQERAEREAREQAEREAYERGQSVVRWRDFEPLVPGPGEVIVGSEDGPVAVAASTIGGNSAGRNLSPATLPHWRKAVGDVRAGLRDARMLCIGDSTTWGSHTASVFTHAYPTRLAAMLDRSYVPASPGIQIPEDITTVITPGVREVGDRRWVASGAWAKSDWGFGRRASFRIGIGNDNDTLTFTPGHACDTFRIWYQMNAGLGTLHISIDGAPVKDEPTATTVRTMWGYVDVSTSLADDHVVSLRGSGGTVVVVGIEAWDSREKRILVGRAGLPGTTVSNWVNLGTGRSNGILEYAPEVSIISLGINDSKGTTPVPTATYLSQIETLVDWCLESGDVILTTFIPSNLGPVQVAAQNAYWDGLRDMADRRHLPLVDLAERFGPAPTATNQGLMVDEWHPNEPGYADMAGAVFAALTSV